MSNTLLHLIDSAAPLTVKQQELRGDIAPASLEALFDEDLSREEILERIDPDTLRSASTNLLVATAVALATDVERAPIEDHVLRYREALTSEELATQAYVRMAAEKLVLSDVEFQQASSRYADVDAAYPQRHAFSNDHVYNDACKIHERRMDRMLRARKEAFDRYERAAEVYRVALLTRDGQQVLVSLATKQQARKPREGAVSRPEIHRSVSTEGQELEVLPAAHEDATSESSQNVQLFIKVR